MMGRGMTYFVFIEVPKVARITNTSSANLSRSVQSHR